MVWDRAGELIAAQAVAQLKTEGMQVHAYKNNVDGKGATWGAHENYLVSRALPLDLLNSLLATVLVTRQIVVGAGRVGLGERSEQAASRFRSAPTTSTPVWVCKPPMPAPC